MKTPTFDVNVKCVLEMLVYMAGSIEKEYHAISSLTIRASEDEYYLDKFQRYSKRVLKAKVLGCYDPYEEVEPGLFLINDLLVFYDGDSSGISLDIVAATSKMLLPEDCSSLFAGLYVDTFSFENVDTSNVKNMNSMFLGSRIGILDISCFETQNVSSTREMFAGCRFQRLPAKLLKPHASKQWVNLDLQLRYGLWDPNGEQTSLNINNCNWENVSDARWMFNGTSVYQLFAEKLRFKQGAQLNGLFSNFTATRSPPDLSMINISNDNLLKFVYLGGNPNNIIEKMEENIMEEEIIGAVNEDCTKSEDTIFDSLENFDPALTTTETSAVGPVNLASLVPEEDQAVEDEASETLSRLRKSTKKLRLLDGMHKISDNLYATITEAKNVRSLRFIQEYADGSFSNPVMLSQSDLFTLAMYLKMKESASADFPFEKEAKKILKFLSMQYFNAAVRVEPLPIEKIVLALAGSFNQLSLHPTQDEENEYATDLYWQAVEYIQKSEIGASPLFKHKKEYFLLIERDIHHIAENIGADSKKMLNIFKQYGFLYLTPSSTEYKTKVRYEDFEGNKDIDRFYCLYKPDFIIKASGKMGGDPYG